MLSRMTSEKFPSFFPLPISGLVFLNQRLVFPLKFFSLHLKSSIFQVDLSGLLYDDLNSSEIPEWFPDGSRMQWRNVSRISG